VKSWPRSALVAEQNTLHQLVDQRYRRDQSETAFSNFPDWVGFLFNKQSNRITQTLSY
jgi:hypothetical protein